MMKKLLFFVFCLLSGSGAFTACSSDNDEPEANDGRKVRQLTISEVPITRATLSDNNDNLLGAIWTEDDQATCFNLSSFTSSNIDDEVLTATTSAETSSFRGYVSCEVNHKLALFYPSKKIIENGETRGSYAITLSGQKGTLEDVATNFHYVYGVGQVTATTENPATATAYISEMKPLLAVCKFTFKDGTVFIPVKTLTIGYGNEKYPDNGTVTPAIDVESVVAKPADPETWSAPLTVTLENETDKGVYVALFPCGNEYAEEFCFTVTNSNGTYMGNANAKLKAGKYYPVTLTLTK